MRGIFANHGNAEWPKFSRWDPVAKGWENHMDKEYGKSASNQINQLAVNCREVEW
jgi:hypothetical protein